MSEPVEIQLEKKFEVGSVLESLDQLYVLHGEYARCIRFNAK